MKLTKKQKEKLIGKKIIIDKIFKKKYEMKWASNDLFKDRDPNMIREIKTISLLKPIKAVIIGFTHLCEGEFYYDDSGVSFICKKRIPCIKIASGIVGKIQYSPIPDNLV